KRVSGSATCINKAIAHHTNAIPHGHGFDLVMGNVDHRVTELSVELGDLRAHLNAHLGVQVRQRFVEEEHLRTAHYGSPQGHTLALAAGESVWFALQHVVEAEGLSGCPTVSKMNSFFFFAN